MTNGIQQLKLLAFAHSRTLYPNFPEYARSVRNYTDMTGNGLQKCIIDFLKFSNHDAKLVSKAPRFIDHSEVVTDVLGTKKRIGSKQWVPGNGKTGIITATIWGRQIIIKVESQKEDAKKNEKGVWHCRTFDEFLDCYHELI